MATDPKMPAAAADTQTVLKPIHSLHCLVFNHLNNSFNESGCTKLASPHHIDSRDSRTPGKYVMRKLLQIIDQTSILSGKISSLLTLIAAIVVVYEVVMRHLLHLPTVWASEFTSMACSALYFLGGAWVLYQNKHVNIEMIYEKFSPKMRSISDVVTYGFFAIYTGMMTWHASVFTYESILLNETTASPWDPFIYPSKFIMAFGFLILFLQGTAKFIRDLHLLIRGEAL